MSTLIRPAARAAFRPLTDRFEGVIPWMYLDVRRLVTVAAGILCDPLPLALPLPFSRPDGRRATREEIAAGWAAVKSDHDRERQARFARLGAGTTRDVCDLRLAPADLDRVVDARLDQMVAALARRFPAFASYPADAQLGLVLMAWALGTGFRFPRFEAALERRDWDTCSAECDIRSEGNAGVIPRNAANRALFALAGLVEREGLDPGELLYRVP